MTKKEKAEKVLFYLGAIKDDWITADCSPPRKTAYTVQGIQEKIFTHTDDSLTDSYRSVARAVVNAGFDYGNCVNIAVEEKDEIRANQELNESFIIGVKNISEKTEKTRISRLSNIEKLFEINEKYRIKIIKYEALDD